jgi:hypothetical protein
LTYVPVHALGPDNHAGAHLLAGTQNIEEWVEGDLKAVDAELELPAHFVNELQLDAPANHGAYVWGTINKANIPPYRP